VSRVKMNAPHGWVRHATYGGKWHRSTCSGTPACGAHIKANPERADVPPHPPQSTGACVCVACFRIAVGADPCCTCGCHADAGKEPARD
jgi:hypothetical protein